MPLHQRQKIREAVRAALVDANTAAGPRVYETRTVQWSQALLPAVAVYTLNEAVDEDSKSTAPRRLTRRLKLEVVAAVRSTDNVDDALDAIADEIERAMARDETFGGVCGDAILSTTEIAVEDGGNKPIGFVALVYDVRYETCAAADDPGPFEGVNAQYNLGGQVHPDDEARDTIDLET